MTVSICEQYPEFWTIAAIIFTQSIAQISTYKFSRLNSFHFLSELVENVITGQSILVIILLIVFLTFSFGYVLLLLKENWCWPLLGLRGSEFNDIMKTKALLTASYENCSVVRRLDYQPLHEKWARACPPIDTMYSSEEVSHLFSCISGAVALPADVVVSPLPLNTEEKPLEQIGRPMQGMTPHLKLMLNLRFANEITQQQLQSPLCYLSLPRFSFLVS